MKKENKKIVGTGIVAFTFGFLSGIILTKKTSSYEEDVNSLSDLPDEIVLDDGADDLPDEIVPDDGVENLPDEISLDDLKGGNEHEEEKGNS